MTTIINLLARIFKDTIMSRSNKSDIFDCYAAIAQEQGLISFSEENEIDMGESKAEEKPKNDNAPKESAKLKKYKKSPAPRAGSDDISTIEALYNTKPDDSVFKYENCITQAAHPKPVVIAPSYDKLNGLVENDFERANIMHNIVMKQTNSLHTNHKYAANKDLLLQLVKIANDMDNRGFEDLREIADICIEKLSESNIEKKKSVIVKVALLPLLIGGAAVLAAIWIWQHMSDTNNGLINNINNAIKELDDLKENSWYESNVDGIVQRDVAIIENKINALRSVAKDFNVVMNDIEKPDAGDINTLNDVNNKIGTDVSAKLDAFVKAVEGITPVLVSAINNFTNNDYQKEHSDPSWASKLSGYVGEALHGRWGLVANDFISAANALETLEGSLRDAYKKATNFDNVKKNSQDDIQGEMAKLKGKTQGGSNVDENGISPNDIMEKPMDEAPSTFKANPNAGTPIKQDTT